LESVDVLRGVVMILMALDHVRDFFGGTVSPVNIAQTTAPLFFTRWITHFCAPVFFTLTGTGAYLARRRRSVSDLSQFLIVRGFWLILLELTLARCLGYQFNFDYRVTMLVILWALGWSMITLGILVRFLSANVVTILGLGLIVAHNAFDRVVPASFGALAPLWSILHVQGFALQSPRHAIFVAYPLIPWIGVTAAGYGLGQIFDWSTDDRRAFLRHAGPGFIVAFVVLRMTNLYGDPAPWTPQPTGIRTLLSFLNANKYPPSLDYLLMTLGPALLFLRAIEERTPRFLNSSLVFGKVPLFYFLLHLPLIHLMAAVVCLVRYGTAHWMFESPSVAQYPFTRPPDWGYGLPAVYLVWVVLVVSLYPVCQWFAALKLRSSSGLLSYL
jgi:uncharacterized membrane protein